jgi:hypothetical protein
VELYGVSWLGQEHVPAAIRQEGDTTIYPVVEEIVVEREAASRDADRDPEA